MQGGDAGEWIEDSVHNFQFSFQFFFLKAIIHILLCYIYLQVSVSPPCAFCILQHQHHFESKLWWDTTNGMGSVAWDWHAGLLPSLLWACWSPTAPASGRHLRSTEHRPACREPDRGHLVSHLMSKQTIPPAFSRIIQPEPESQPGRKGSLVLAPSAAADEGFLPPSGAGLTDKQAHCVHSTRDHPCQWLFPEASSICIS